MDFVFLEESCHFFISEKIMFTQNELYVNGREIKWQLSSC